MDVQHHHHQQQQEDGFSVVSLDQSFFFYDSLLRRVWIDGNNRPVVRVTGSHKHSCTFAARILEGKQPFRQYDKFNGDTFLDYLKKIHIKFSKCYSLWTRHHHIVNRRRCQSILKKTKIL